MKAGIIANVNGDFERLEKAMGTFMQEDVDYVFILGNMLRSQDAISAVREAEQALRAGSETRTKAQNVVKITTYPIDEEGIKCLDLIDYFYARFRALRKPHRDRLLLYLQGRNERDLKNACKGSEDAQTQEIYRKFDSVYNSTGFTLDSDFVYELSNDLRPLKHYYLGDQEKILRAIASVAGQGKASRP